MKKLPSFVRRQHGFAHHLILPVLAVLAVAGIGAYILGIDHAAALESTITVTSNSKQCVDNKQGKKVTYNTVQIYTCNKGTNQEWSVAGTATTAGAITNYNGYCLNVYNTGKTAGTPVDIYPCKNSPAQQWTVNTSTGAIVNPNSKLCLAWTSPAVTTGTPLKLAACNTKATTDQWTVKAVSGTTGTGSGTGSGSSGSGSSSTTGTCSAGGSKLQTLQDSFAGTALNANNWYVEPIAGQGNTLSGSVKVSGGILTLSQNTGYTSVNSQKSYDATGSCGFMKLIPDPNSTADQADDGWGLWNSTTAGDGNPGFSNGYEIGVQSGKLYGEVVVGDNDPPFSFSATYNPSTMVYARIRESGGKLYFGYSADGSTWTEPSGWSITWNSSIVNVAKCSVQIYAGNLGSKNAGSAGFADFNVAK